MRDFSIDLVWAKLQMAIAAVGGWLGYFVGGVDGLMTALLVLMVMDYVTGIMCAVIDQGYWPDSLLTAPDDEAFIQDIQLIKQMGFNGVRKHQKVEDRSEPARRGPAPTV